MLLLSAELKSTGLEPARVFTSTEANMQWVAEMSIDLCAQGRWTQEALIYPFKGGIWNEQVLTHSPFQNRLQPLPYNLASLTSSTHGKGHVPAHQTLWSLPDQGVQMAIPHLHTCCFWSPIVTFG